MQFLDVITIVTGAGILAILVLYVVVVYRKGWLKRDMKGSESYYLCPNSGCRRAFKDPIWLTDLSKTPPDSYQACPHCSTSLQLSPSFVSVAGSIKPKSPPKAVPLINDPKPTDKVPPIHQETISQKEGIIREVTKPTHFGTGISQRPEKSSSLKPSPPVRTFEFRKETPSKQAEMPKKREEKETSGRPRACSHYFGYVKTLPKNTSIPDECLWCPWIVDCLAGKRKIEA